MLFAAQQIVPPTISAVRTVKKMERMQMEVRAVAGIDNCFVSFPLHLLQALQSTRSSPLPPLLAFELRSGDRRWYVAWAGSTSSSSTIEIARIFADSISLPDHTIVQVRALSSVPKATLVTIEPDTEDDWEVLELNAELAEAAILGQVRIVHEKMRFPLWLHDRTVITFVVVSTFPSNGVVQLVPGTEVAVAPKRRKRDLTTHEVSDRLSSNRGDYNGKAVLRVQNLDRSVFHESNVKGFEMRVVLTSVAYIHPETASKCSLQSLQLVSVSPRFPPRDHLKNFENEASRLKTSQASKVADSIKLKERKESRQVIVSLLVSDSVAKGHVVMSQSLRLYLRTSLHSWIYLKACDFKLKKEIPALSISPCHFRMSGKDQMLKSDAEVFESRRNFKTKGVFPETGLSTYTDVVDWSMHDDVIASLSAETVHKEEQETVHQSRNGKGLECLLHVWASAQLDAIALAAGVDVNTLFLGSETLLHFEVKRCRSSDCGNIQALTRGHLDDGNNNKMTGLPVEILYVLTISDESLLGDKFSAYTLTLDKRNRKDSMGGVELMVEKLSLGDPVSFYSIKERNSANVTSPDISSLTWMGPVASDVIKRMAVLLSPAAGMWFSHYSLPLPGHVLIYGPPGSGKTILARAAAKYLEEHKDLLGHVIFVSCSALALEKVQAIRPALSNVVSEALECAPSVVILDDLDSIVSSSSDSEASQPSATVIALTKFLTDIIDEYGEKRMGSCGMGPIAFVASVQSLDNIPQSLCSSGRFDYHVQLAAPAAAERGAILKHEIQKRSLECSDDVLQVVASKCEGYDAYDLQILVDRAVHAAVGRLLPSEFVVGKHMKHTLVREDFSQAMHEFVPVAMRDITKSASEGGRSGWEDVGGLTDIRNAIEEMIELPSKFPNIFAKAPLRLRSNVLLYGPPGCGKTHVVGAAAAACSLRFISVKGPELLNKYIGASEQAVRDIFAKAAAAAPCLLFFDEFDSIAPKRGHDNTGVTDRVVNQFLTELDGVEVLTGVFVFAATSRPDLLDAALLRPGRLDRLLFCDFPSRHDRHDILTVLSRKLPMAIDVDLDAIAQSTEGFSGADLQALLSDAQLAAVHEFLNREDTNEPGRTPVITNTLLKSIASKSRPSISETEKQRLYDIYSQFLDSKRSVSAQSRDAKGKGKKATLA